LCEAVEAGLHAAHSCLIGVELEANQSWEPMETHSQVRYICAAHKGFEQVHQRDLGV